MLAEEAARARRHHPYGALVIGMAVCQLVGWGVTYFAFPVFVQPMQAELGWTTTQINGALTAGLVLCDLASIPAGQWFDRRGGREMISLGASFAALMMVAWSRVESLAGLYLVFAGMGLSQAMALNNMSFAVVTANVSDFRRGLNMVTLVAGLAPSAALPLAGWLTAAYGWRVALLALAAVQFLGCAVVAFVVLRGTIGSRTHESAEDAARDGSPLRAALVRPAFWLIVLAFSIHWFVSAGVSMHGLGMFQERGMSREAALGLMTFIGPAQVAGRLALMLLRPAASGRAIGRILWIALSAALGAFALMGPASFGAFVAFAILYGAASGVLIIARLTVVAELFGLRGYGAISGAISTAAIAARTGAPLTLAVVHDYFGGYDEIATVMACLALIGAAAFFAATARPAQPASQ